jgi:hypothetical protein
MSKLMIAVIGLAMLTASVNAELGESPLQMESGQPLSTEKSEDGQYDILTWVVSYRALGNKPLLHVGMFPPNGKAIGEVYQFTDRHPMTSREIELFLKPYKALRRSSVSVLEGGQQFDLLRRDGSVAAVVDYDKGTHTLTIATEAAAFQWAAQVNQWRALPNETAWQWLKRNCQGKECAKNKDAVATGPIYWNWPDDRHEPLMDNFEISPNESLLVKIPFMPPTMDDPLYNAEAEAEIENKTTAYPSQVVRFYRRGVFLGYKTITPEKQPEQAVKL